MDGSKNAERRPLGAIDEEDPGRHRAPVFEEDDANEKAPRRSRRVASLDVFRGLTVAVSDSTLSERALTASHRWSPFSN
jgi:heparan-alpha-glucosaminide N-acetyltransferase